MEIKVLITQLCTRVIQKKNINKSMYIDSSFSLTLTKIEYLDLSVSIVPV